MRHGRAGLRRGWLTGAVVLSLAVASCVSITVNVFFPEREVKQALQSLEGELLRRPEGTGQAPARPPEQKQNFRLTPGGEERRWVWRGEALLFLLTAREALAQAGNVTQELRGMPDVMDAYRRMGARLPQVDRLRNEGKVGEADNGLLSPRGALSGDEGRLVEQENQDRRVVISGIARAVLRIQKAPVNDDTLRRVQPDAVRTFAEQRRNEAQSGWWVQLPGGRWVRK
ncbi:MAG: DUF1318 domain-containing protein [Deltaproteobacteria bacterium]|nr:DUF1318 domain-containing protein [Deltaproteobacteria bacterium]MBI3078908.1 DUF1318 domain-containing protein [Deltaproteobacteria bacterium]